MAFPVTTIPPSSGGGGSSAFGDITGWPGASTDFVRGDGSDGPLGADDIRGTVTGTAGEGKVIADDGASGLEWITPSATDSSKIPLSTVTTKGDLIAATGSGAVTRRGVGTSGQFLAPNSGNSDGLEWRALVPGDIPFYHELLSATKSGSQGSFSGSYADNVVNWETVGTNQGTNFTNASGTFTCNKAGRYLVHCALNVTSGGAIVAYCAIQKNGTSTHISEVASIANPTPHIAGIVDLALNDTLRISLALNSGSGVNVTNAAAQTYLTITYIGKAS